MIGEKIKKLRTGKGITQDTMAKALGVSPQSVSKWEQNTTSPDIGMLVPIADFFGVSVDFLLREPICDEPVDPAEIVEIRSWKDRALWRCAVKNISGNVLSKVSLKTYFYDENGSVIDYRDNLIYDLEPGTEKPELLYSSTKEKAVAVKIAVKHYPILTS